MLVDSQVLLLNASYEPINIMSIERAINLILQSKVEVLEIRVGCAIHSENLEIAQPTVIRLIKYAPVPRHRKAYLNRRGVLTRDGHTCAYCGLKATTMDHVQPRSKGGRHTWENVVACCFPCNQRKDDRSLIDMGWRLKFKPYVPEGARRLIMIAGRMDPTWVAWLPDDTVA